MKIGQEITITNRIARKAKFKDGRRWKEWEKKHFSPVQGIFLGYRNISDGWADWEEECGFVYMPVTHHKAMLVIKLDGRTNPFYTMEADNE